jgi:hypothetical protein
LQKGIGIVVFSALMVLGSEVVLWWVLIPAGSLYFEVHKTHKTG